MKKRFIVWAGIAFLLLSPVCQTHAGTGVGFMIDPIDASSFSLSVWVSTSGNSLLVEDGVYVFTVSNLDAVTGVLSSSVASKFTNYSITVDFDQETGLLEAVMEKGPGPPKSVAVNTQEIVFTIVFSIEGEVSDFYWAPGTDLPFPGATAPDVAEDQEDAPLVDGPLPVTLLSFDAKRDASPGSVVLEWKTAQEKNNDRFEILRSRDGSTFSVIGTVVGQGTTNNITWYDFVDRVQGFSGKILYYKLRQVDYDGTSEEFRVVSVSVLSGITMSISGKVIRIENPGMLEVVTARGIVVSRTHLKEGGEKEITSLKDGVHIARFIGDDGEITVVKFFVQ